MRSSVKLLVLSSCLLAHNGFASDNTPFPLTPGVSISGFTGSGTTGYGDILAPVFGQTNRFIFLDPQTQYHNSQDYTGSLGLGFRQLHSQAGILGAYVFADYNHRSDTHGFWFISPGIERLGDRIDFSANLYVPVGPRRATTGTCFAESTDEYKYLRFTNHEAYDRLVDTFNSVGFGGDAQVGFRLPLKNNPELYLGGYHFSPKDADSFTGASARLRIPLTSYLSVDLSETYDSEAHNVFKGGVTLYLGGRNSHYSYKPHDLTQRLVDPIQRNLVSIAGNSPTAQPIEKSKKLTDKEGVLLSNISFFSPNGVADGNCTYENRCALNQTNIDNANDLNNRNFFIQSGIYGDPSNGLPALFFTYDNVSGRDYSYKKPATIIDNNLPVIFFANDGAYLFGNNQFSALNLVQNNTSGINNALIVPTEGTTRLSNLILEGAGPLVDSTGILISNPIDDNVEVLIDHSFITNFNLGIGILDQNFFDDSQLNVTIQDSSLFGNSNGINAENLSSGDMNIRLLRTQLSGLGIGSGVALTNTTGTMTFVMDRSSINNFGLGYSNLNLLGNSWLSITNSSITNNISSGILALNDTGRSKLTVINSNVSNNGIGLIADNLSSHNFSIYVGNSIFENNAVGFAVDELTSLYIDHSIVIGPNTPQLVVGGNGANITVNDPIYFDGIAINSGGSLVFQRNHHDKFELPQGTAAFIQCARGICIIS